MKEKLGKKLLIVDDEPQLLHILGDQFEEEGFTVFTAQDAAEGIKIATKELPDLMLVDVVMPKMDGIAMLKELKEQSGTQNIPAILLTNLSDPQTTAEALKVGAFDHMVKTQWDVAGVVAKVKEKLSLS